MRLETRGIDRFKVFLRECSTGLAFYSVLGLRERAFENVEDGGHDGAESNLA